MFSFGLLTLLEPLGKDSILRIQTLVWENDNFERGKYPGKMIKIEMS